METAISYGGILSVHDEMIGLGDKVFHHTTVHKPDVRLGDPRVEGNSGRFIVEFYFDLPDVPASPLRDIRWMRLKSVRQYMDRLSTVGSKYNLTFSCDYEEMMFSVRGGLLGNRDWDMCVGFWVTALVKDEHDGSVSPRGE